MNVQAGALQPLGPLVDPKLAAGAVLGSLLSLSLIHLLFPSVGPATSPGGQALAGLALTQEDVQRAEGVWTGQAVVPPQQGWASLWAGGSSSSSAGLHQGQVVCWTSWNHGGYGGTGASSSSSPSAPSAPSLPGGVMVYGRGCKRCVVGAVCSFLLSIQRPAHWLERASPRQRELMVHLAGPALVVADVKQMPPLDGSSFLITYLLWDPGNYRISIRLPCNALNYTASFEGLKAHEMAAWDMTVHASGGPDIEMDEKPTSQEEDQAAGDAGASGTGPAAAAGAGSVEDQRPCAQATSLQARWWRPTETSNYTWLPFPCAEVYSLHDWIPELNRRGVHEISFVGDSHQRTLMHHLLYLLSREIDWPNHLAHSDLSYTVKHTGGGSLRLNLYFISGIYAAGVEFGCKLAERNSSQPVLPKLSETADVVVVEAGYWTGAMCSLPEEAFAAYIPGFLLWLERSMSKQKTGREKPPLLVYRSTPPRATDKSGCDPLTNNYIQFANTVAKGLCPFSKTEYLDLWKVEAARYLDNCPGDHMYSCVKRQQVSGVVGDADVKALIHFLLREQAKRA